MSLLRISNHGGSCCGIKHLSGFGLFHPRATNYKTKEEFILKSLKAVVDNYRPKKTDPFTCSCNSCMTDHRANAARRKMTMEEYTKELLDKYNEARRTWVTAVECVLAGSQYEGWKEPLEKCGFKEVFTFKNSNSGNVCHVFYGTTNPREDKRVESAPEDTEIAG